MNSRKYRVTLLTIASCTGLVAFGAIEGGVYATVVSSCVLAYIAGNVAQKATAKSAPGASE